MGPRPANPDTDSDHQKQKPREERKKKAPIPTTVWQRACKGASHSFDFPEFWSFVTRSKTLQGLTGQCFLLNAVVICGSAYLFSVLHSVALSLLPNHSLHSVLEVVFQVLWALPVRIIAWLLNMIWCSYISDEAYRLQTLKSGEPPRPPSQWSYVRVLSLLSDEIYKGIMVTIFSAMASAAGMLTGYLWLLGYLISFFLNAWLYAFYAFDYRWMQTTPPWTLTQKISTFERHWDYYLGYGFFPTLISYAIAYKSSFTAFGLASVLFPVHIIISLVRHHPPLPSSSGEKEKWYRPLPIFRPAMRCVNFLALRGKKKEDLIKDQ